MGVKRWYVYSPKAADTLRTSAAPDWRQWEAGVGSTLLWKRGGMADVGKLGVLWGSLVEDHGRSKHCVSRRALTRCI